MKYAQQTSVSVDNSRNEIERTLKRYGAKEFMYASSGDKALIMFQAKEKRIRFILALPNRNDRKFTHTQSRGVKRTIEAQEKEYEQACRQKWRALLLVIKAKLEAVDSGISIFEEEFMANIILPGTGGQTVGEYVLPKINEAYVSNTLPPMLDFWGGK